ncbi:MAG TPA: cyclodeaminase [Thermoleophilia bacterium]
MNVTILGESEIRACVGMEREAMDAVAEGFTRLAEGRAYAPPVVCMLFPEHNGEVDIKTASIDGLDSFAVKVASGFFDNPKRGLPYGGGMMILMSAETGFLQALLADNGYLTDLRTGLAGAIAATHLAPATVTTAGVIGSGTQARYQIRGLKLVRDFERLVVYGVIHEEVQRYAEEMERELGVTVTIAATPESVVRQSEFVVTTTPSREPYLEAVWLQPGVHVTCMGADMEDKQELHADCFGIADLVACDRLSQCRVIGELHHALDDGAVDETEIVELGDLTGGRRPGRTSADQITICDLTGVGVQDTAIARLAYARATQRGLGAAFESA